MSGCTYLTNQQISLMNKNLSLKPYAIRNQSILFTGIITGLRISDVLELTINDISFPDRSIKDKIYIIQKKTKRGIEPEIDDILKEYYKTLLLWLWNRGIRSRRRHIFPGRTSEKISVRRIQQVFNECAQECRISGRISTHTMRKTFARIVYYECIKRRIDPWPVLMVKLDHKSIASTQRYLSFLFTESYGSFSSAFDDLRAVFAG